MGRNATKSLSIPHVLMHKQSAMVKPVERWNKRSLQKTDFKKTCSEVVTRKFCCYVLVCFFVCHGVMTHVLTC